MTTLYDPMTPVSPFDEGPYTPPTASGDPVTAEAQKSPFVSVLKLVVLILFVALAINPAVFGWAAGVIAGVLMFGWVIRLTGWFKRNIEDI